MYGYHEFRNNASTCQKVANPLVFISTILDMLQVDYEAIDDDPVFIFTHRLTGVYREQIDDEVPLTDLIYHVQDQLSQLESSYELYYTPKDLNGYFMINIDTLGHYCFIYHNESTHEVYSLAWIDQEAGYSCHTYRNEILTTSNVSHPLPYLLQVAQSLPDIDSDDIICNFLGSQRIETLDLGQDVVTALQEVIAQLKPNETIHCHMTVEGYEDTEWSLSRDSQGRHHSLYYSPIQARIETLDWLE